MKRALIVGHSGQDGTLLTNSLLKNGYSVLGIGRNSVYWNDQEIKGERVDITKEADVNKIVHKYHLDEIYYLAAYNKSSEYSYEQIELNELFLINQNTHVIGVLNFLSSITKFKPETKLFYASSSLVYKGGQEFIQDEKTPLDPYSVYGITKAQGMWLCREFRLKLNIFVSIGILYNHESHLRPEQYLSSKVIKAAIRIATGSSEKVEIGNLQNRVDWGYAPDYISAFQKILKLDVPDDFIVATGEDHSVKEFIEIVFAYFELDWEQYVVINNNILSRNPSRKVGNATKLKKLTRWQPSYSFYDFVRKLVEDHLDSQGLFKLKRSIL